MSVYSCANKKVDGFAVYTNTVPAGAFRGYGLPQALFAVESAIDELARRSASAPATSAAATSSSPATHDVGAAVATTRRAHRQLRPRPVPRPGRARDACATRRAGLAGVADRRRLRADHDRDRAAGRAFRRRDDHVARRRWLDITVGTAEFGNGTTTCTGRSPRRAGTTVDQIRLRQSDTAHGGHDTGAFGSAGTFVAGKATHAVAMQLAQLDQRRRRLACDARNLRA